MAVKDLIPLFFGDTAKTYDQVAYWATFGKDDYWKKEIVDKINNIRSLLELACGTGKLTKIIISKFPNANIVGIDVSESYLDMIDKKSFPNVSFVHQDAEKLNLDQKFDCICSSYIPKYCNPEILIKRCVEHLNPSGFMVFHDFVFPKNNFVKILWKFHFLLLRLLGNAMPSWKYAFLELPKLIQTSNWVDEYTIELEKNGFDVTQQSLTWNSSVILHARQNI